MAERSLGLRVKREHGERMRKALAESGLLDRSRKILSDDAHVYLPILEMDAIIGEKLELIAPFEPVQIDFPAEERPLAPEDILGYRPSFEVVGDIALVEEGDAENVAAAIMATTKSIKAIITPVSDVEGEFRTRRFRHVAARGGAHHEADGALSGASARCEWDSRPEPPGSAHRWGGSLSPELFRLAEHAGAPET